MLWTVLGLVVTAAVAIEGAITGTKNTGLKIFLLFLAVAGFAASLGSSISDKKDADASAKSMQEQLSAEKRQLDAQAPMIAFVNQTVGDLGTLNRLTTGETYYVRIAAGPKSVLDGYLEGIEQKFKGAGSNGLLAVRPRHSNCNPDDQHASCYELIFGSHLTPAAAEVFERFANENGFPPPNEHAYMEPEPGQQ
jgi:hypothetical protein